MKLEGANRTERNDETPEYGPVIGMTVPQANTTVEPEMQRLIGGTLLTARLSSALADSRARLVDYFDCLPQTLAQFDVAPVRAAGFACTGSCYLVGRAEEEWRLTRASAVAGFPVISSAQAIVAALDDLGVKRIALLSPYPTWLSEAGQAYWRAAGFTITSVTGLPQDLLDTRAIYKLTSKRVTDMLSSLDTRGADAVLLSGTGMPTLRAMGSFRSSIPVLSSNLCLAWALAKVSSSDTEPATKLAHWLEPSALWRSGLGALHSSSSSHLKENA
jgi:maleate isomerase